MLYQKYENRIKKIARIKVGIYKYRLPILIGMSIILVLTSWLLIKKGTIKEDLALSSSEIVYGEEYSVSAKVFMGEASYQYKSSDGEWTDGLPKLVGEYLVRLKSRRTFGFFSYGEEQQLNIGKKPLEVSYNPSIKYGDNPLKEFAVNPGDKVENYSLTKDKLYVGTSSVGLKKDSVQITNADGEDVTFCYEIDYKSTRKITVSEKIVYITAASATKTYDGTPLEKHEFSQNGSVCYSDKLILTFKGSITDVGSAANEIDAVKIIDENGEDRTDNYLIREKKGTLTVNKRPLSVKPVDVKEVYDGMEHSASNIEIVSGSLAVGEKVNEGIRFNGSRIDAGKSDASINANTFSISGKNGLTLNNYKLTFKTGSLEVTPRPITLTDKLSKTYDDSV
ncbi:MAG: hypothetical protein J6T42_03635, partial [Clostridia bacterium]|nr:hypothetical protein [Clostridia bacterium]